jgi:hypothetical protein
MMLLVFWKNIFHYLSVNFKEIRKNPLKGGKIIWGFLIFYFGGLWACFSPITTGTFNTKFTFLNNNILMILTLICVPVVFIILSLIILSILFLSFSIFLYIILLIFSPYITSYKFNKLMNNQNFLDIIHKIQPKNTLETEFSRLRTKDKILKKSIKKNKPKK